MIEFYLILKKKINLSTQDRKGGFYFKTMLLFPHMTVSQNIELGLLKLSKSEKGNSSKVLRYT